MLSIKHCAIVAFALSFLFFGLGLWGGHHFAKSTIKPIVVHEVEFVEKKVYVKQNSTTHATTTKPDGTVITVDQTTTTDLVGNETIVSVTKTRPSFTLGGQVLKDFRGNTGGSVTGSARITNSIGITGQMGYLNKPFIGLGLEVGFD